MSRSLTILAWVLFLVAPSLPAEEKTDALLRELFLQDDPPAATKQIDALLAACDNDSQKVRALITSDTAYASFQPGVLKRTSTVFDDRDKKTYPLDFFVRVPKGYDPGKAWPVLLLAHGQHGSGQSILRAFTGLLGRDLETYIVVAPSLPGIRQYSGRPYQEQTFLKPLLWICRNLNVDDDRVYVSGYSLGGTSSWHLATMFPRHFAATVPMAGVPFYEGGLATMYAYLENLSHIPVWAIWGELDKAKPNDLGNRDLCRMVTARLTELKNPHYRGTELKGVGHAGAWPKPDAFAEFLTSHTRQAVPKRIEWRFHLAHHSRGYYLDAIELARKPEEFRFERQIPIRLPPGEKPTDENVMKAFREYFNKRLFKMSAELRPTDNTVIVRAVSVRKLRLYVMDGMVDPARPVKIAYWDRMWQGGVPVSARCMLLNYAARRDPSALVFNEIDLTPTLKPVLRFK